MLGIPPSYAESRHVEKLTAAMTGFVRMKNGKEVGETDSWAAAGQSKRQREPEKAVAADRLRWWVLWREEP